jgi:hypothetical protein
MIKKRFFGVIAFFLIIFVSTFAGCIQSHSEEFNKANSLVDAGTFQITPLVSSNFTSANLTAIRVNTTAVKGDFSEAMNILDKIPSKELSDKDQMNLKALKILIDANMKISELLETKFLKVSEEYQNSMYSPLSGNVMNSGNLDSYTIDSNDMKSNLSMIKSNISTIKISINENFNKLNYADLSPNTLLIYNETGDRLVIFNNNIDTSITYLENACLKRCFAGKVLGTDCNCHPECGTGKYCDNGFECCNEKCYSPCGFASKRDLYCSCITLPTMNIPTLGNGISNQPYCDFDCQRKKLTTTPAWLDYFK